MMPAIDRKLEEAQKRGRRLDSQKADSNILEVFIISADRPRIVNLKDRTCSCKEFQQKQYHCRHASHCILKIGKDVKDFTHVCFTVDSYRKIYSVPIMPIRPWTIGHPCHGASRCPRLRCVLTVREEQGSRGRRRGSLRREPLNVETAES